MTTSRKGNNITVIVSVIAIAMLVVALIYLIDRVFRTDPVKNVCLEVLPQDQRVGMKFERRGDTITMDLAGQRGVQTGATPQQIDGFVKCIEATANVKVTIDNGVRLSLEPVGQVANRWRREPGVKLRLMPGLSDEILNNIRIGPATGLKEDVVRVWCQQQAAACVTCDPDQPNPNTVEVLVRLRESPPVTKSQLDGRWPTPQPGVPPESWQMVNAKGERFYYECKGS